MTTIYALSTVPGRSAVALIRASGSGARTILHQLTGDVEHVDRLARLRTLRHPITKEKLDRALVTFFKSPRSFTGEDTAEFCLHGSKAVCSAVLDAISHVDADLRLAEPGEFSKRAFMNGKMDLTQAEGLADLIDSETEEQRKRAFNQSEGQVTRACREWRDEIIELRSQLEAVIDFGEDNDDVETGIMHEVGERVEQLIESLTKHVESSLRGELVRTGIRAVIIGPPNVGKSSIMNSLIRRDVSIVSPVAGTTRDVVESAVDLAGYPVIFQDTAGIRKDGILDPVETIGIERSMKRSMAAQLRIIVLSLPLNHASLKEMGNTLTELDVERASLVRTICILNKSDLAVPSADDIEQCCSNLGITPNAVCIHSCLNEDGTQDLLTLLKHELGSITGSTDPACEVMLNERHRAQLIRCLGHLRACGRLDSDSLVYVAEELRYAGDSLGRITGAIDVEEVLVVVHAYNEVNWMTKPQECKPTK